MIDQTPEDELDYYDIKKIEHKKLKERWNAAITEETLLDGTEKNPGTNTLALDMLKQIPHQKKEQKFLV